jgi:hypothetical protein
MVGRAGHGCFHALDRPLGLLAAIFALERILVAINGSLAARPNRSAYRLFAMC